MDKPCLGTRLSSYNVLFNFNSLPWEILNLRGASMSITFSSSPFKRHFLHPFDRCSHFLIETMKIRVLTIVIWGQKSFYNQFYTLWVYLPA